MSLNITVKTKRPSGESLVDKRKVVVDIWVSFVEERFKYLVLGKTKASSNSIRVHVFGPMPKDKRDMLRHLAERWSLFIYSAGRDPKRFLIIQATQKSRAPVRSIMPKGSLPTIGLVQPPPFNSFVDMDLRLVLALFDLPREAEVSSLILRFGGECELVWLNDKNALAIFTDPARAATSLRRVDHASIYRGAIVVPHNGGLPNHNAWATKYGSTILQAEQGWVVWEINPDAAMRGGTRSLIAFKRSNGTVLVQIIHEDVK